MKIVAVLSIHTWWTTSCTTGGIHETFLHKPRWWFQIFFYFHPYLGKWSNLTNIFQLRWNRPTSKNLDILTLINMENQSVWTGRRFVPVISPHVDRPGVAIDHFAGAGDPLVLHCAIPWAGPEPKRTPGDFTTSEATVVNYIVWLCVLLSFWSCYVSTCKTGTFRLETLNCQVLCIVHTCAIWGKLSSWNYFV